jgi:hypothetical protein
MAAPAPPPAPFAAPFAVQCESIECSFDKDDCASESSDEAECCERTNYIPSSVPAYQNYNHKCCYQ